MENNKETELTLFELSQRIETLESAVEKQRFSPRAHCDFCSQKQIICDISKTVNEFFMFLMPEVSSGGTERVTSRKSVDYLMQLRDLVKKFKIA